MRLAVKRNASGRDHWRLVITATDLARDSRLSRRLSVAGGSVRAELDDASADRAPAPVRRAARGSRARALPPDTPVARSAVTVNARSGRPCGPS